MDIEINEFLIGKLKCFGAPHVRERAFNGCVSCQHTSPCAETAIKMILTISAGNAGFKGVTSNKRQFIERVGRSLHDDYIVPKMPLPESDVALIEACYDRSRHFLSGKALDEYFELDDLLDELVSEMESISSADVMPSNVIMPPISTPSSSTPHLPEPHGPSPLPVPDENHAKEADTGVTYLNDYNFPLIEGAQEHFDALKDTELVSALEKVMKRCDSDGKLVCYMDLRDDICTISVVMNQRGVQPPAFRPKRSLPNPTLRSEFSVADTIMMIDRQIIDLHWLHCCGKRDLLDDNRAFAELFAGDELDFDLAEQFAKKSWAGRVKTTKVLGLIQYEQWQMAFFRSRDVEHAWRNARTSMQQTIGKRLREQAVREPRLASHIEEMKLLWLADKMAIHLGQKIVGQVYSWLTGTPKLAPSTLSVKLRRMRRRTNSK